MGFLTQILSIVQFITSYFFFYKLHEVFNDDTIDKPTQINLI